MPPSTVQLLAKAHPQQPREELRSKNTVELSVKNSAGVAASLSSVAEMFAGRSVVITGATGFLGGVLLERLLRCCPEMNKAFVLVRERRGKSPKTRVDKLLSSPLFSGHSTSSLERVVPISGDVSLPELGLTDDDKTLLIASNVSLVFHVAATINFNAALHSAVNINVAGTRRVLQLCQALPQIQALVYVSTVYCNCVVKDTIREEVYPSAQDPDEVIRTVLNMSPEEAKKATTRLIGGHPNTYSFSKQLAENLLKREHGSLPIAIVRPSIVLGIWSDPVPGWVYNIKNGAMAFIAGAGKGVFRIALAEPSAKADMVPADHIAALCIASAWRAAHDGPGSLKVYHGTSGSRNPLTWDSYIRTIVDACRDEPCTGCLWFPGAKIRKSFHRALVAAFIYQLLPAFLMGVPTRIARACGVAISHPLLKIQQKYVFGMRHVKFFTTAQWDFCTRNAEALRESLTPADAATLCFDALEYDWNEYLRRCVRGVRHFFHRETDEKLPLARRQIQTLRVVSAIGTVLTVILLTVSVCSLFGTKLSTLIAASLLVWLTLWL